MNDQDKTSDVEVFEPLHPAIPLLSSEIDRKTHALGDFKSELTKLEQQKEQLLASIEHLRNVEIVEVEDIVSDLKETTVLLLERSIIKNENYEKLLQCFLLDDKEFIDFLASKFEFTTEEEQVYLDKDLSEETVYRYKAHFLAQRRIQDIDPDELYRKNGNNDQVINLIHNRLSKLAGSRY